MSPFPEYHAPGLDQPPNSYAPGNHDESSPWRPPIAARPVSYQQNGTLPSAPLAHLHAPTAPAPAASPSSSSAGPSAAQQMTSDMEQTAQLRPKKRDRHAYHNIQGPGRDGDALNGHSMPHGDQNSSQLAGPPPWEESLITPAMSQFPAPANPVFTPEAQATRIQYAARSAEAPHQVGATSIGPGPGRIDPEQIPSIPRSRDAPAKYYLENVYPTMEHHLPPPATVPFVAFDQGNSSPKFARLTLNNIPTSASALLATSLPLGIVIQPLAAQQEGEQPIPVLDFGESGPPRCTRCRAYINPFMQFKSGGNKFVCNMCTYPNQVAGEYFAPTDHTGVRLDRMQRPELTLGTVDFVVPKEYWSREPVGLRWLFLIDVSAEAVSRGFLHAICEGIAGTLYGAQDDQSKPGETSTRLPKGAKVGFITYNREIHFYNLGSGRAEALMMVMSEIDDPFVPLSEGFLVDPEDSKAAIESLLAQLPTMFSNLQHPEPALLPALISASMALSSTGGKVVCSLAALPTWGPGHLFQRENEGMHGTDAERKLYHTEHPGFKGIAEKMVRNGVGVDFFLTAPSGGYLDIATIGHVSATTGGEVFYYPNFHSPRDCLRISKEIKHTLTRETGYQALMKVRCSNGLQVSAYHGNFYHHTFGADLEFGVIDADKAISVMFRYDGKLDPKLDAHFQSALLYTTASGARRVRCINMVAGVSQHAGECMKFVDQDAVVSIIAREAVARVSEKNLKETRGLLSEKVVDILAGYRKNFTGNNPPGQLVLPENLKEFSMYILGLMKSRALKGGKEPTDRRVHDMKMMNSMGPLELSLYLYPRIIAIHNLDETTGFANERGHLVMPNSVRSSFSKIEEGGAYLVDNGQICLLWLHARVSPNLLEDLFGQGVNSLHALDPFQSSLPVLDTHLNAQVRNILHYLASTRGSKMLTIQLARQGLDGAEYEFARLLYEDRNNDAQSYVDWLVHLHRFIQLEVR